MVTHGLWSIILYLYNQTSESASMRDKKFKLQLVMIRSKGCFFSESAICFSDLQISKKNIFQKAILSLKFKFPAKNSKQQIQISSSG